jgi:hypothetical protein
MDLLRVLNNTTPLTGEQSPLVGSDALGLAREATNGGIQPFSVVFAQEPKFESLTTSKRPIRVISETCGISTAGLIVEDESEPGRFGVTAALHAIGPSRILKVDEAHSEVVRQSEITDSAFVCGLVPRSKNERQVKIMKGFGPRARQNATFVGAASRKRSTVIIGWDPQIPTPGPHRQALIYTGRDAQPGDSGSALVTDDGWTVGFAFERSLPDDAVVPVLGFGPTQ